MTTCKNDLDHHRAIMRKCIDAAHDAAAQGEYALAAAVAIDGDIVALESSGLLTSTDPSAHPEMVAIRAAAKSVQSKYIDQGVLYSTLEPCPMCSSVAVWAQMTGIVFGASQNDAIAWNKNHSSPKYTWRQISIRAEQIAESGEPRLWVVGGVEREQCVELFDLVLDQ